MKNYKEKPKIFTTKILPLMTTLCQDNQLFKSSTKPFKPEAVRTTSSKATTRSGTPESRSKDSADEGECSSAKQLQSRIKEFIIDVKPKRKTFKTVQEKLDFVKQYKMKYKTELCKNYELKGFCKFGNACSFAHGKQELQEKTHLHERYKTKLCKEFHQNGYCSYGIRCQYLHKNAMGVNIFYEPSTEFVWNCERNSYSYEFLAEIWKLSKSKSVAVETVLERIPKNKSRLPIFSAITACRGDEINFP